MLRWGILGTGNIARQFTQGLGTSKRGRAWAVGSRSQAAAEAFAQAHGIGRSYGGYEALLADAEVDAVYVSLPNTLHAQWTLAALAAGKHVLCEKPMAMTVEEARAMFGAARGAGRVLMEAFMYRCHPQTLAVQEAVRQGRIGRVVLIRSSFCYRTTKIDGNVRFDPALGGGALMDIGCYCVNFSRLFGGEPSGHSVSARRHARGVDDMVVGHLTFPGGVLASFTAGMGAHADNTAYICGDEGYIEIPVPWKPPAASRWVLARSAPPRQDGKAPGGPPPREVAEVKVEQDLYGLEADAFARCVLDGAPLPVSEADTLGNTRVLQEMRSAMGLAY